MARRDVEPGQRLGHRRDGGRLGEDAGGEVVEDRGSRASARSEAPEILDSSSPSSTLVKRMASTMVWRWTNSL